MNLPLSAAITLAAMVVAVTSFLLLRRRAPDGGYFNNGDRAAGVFGVLATGFSVLLGFVVFLAFTSYDDARSGSEREATDVIQQYETAQLFSGRVAPMLAGELVCYGRSVVNLEWPLLAAGRSPLFNPWGLPLFRTLRTVVPSTPAQQAAYAKWLDQTSDREQARRDRIHGGTGVIPLPLWLILLVSASLVVVYAFFFVDSGEGKLPQALLIGTLTAMVATSLLVIRFLDNPYHPGYGSLKPVEMSRVLGQMQQATKTLHLPVRGLCDGSGRPLLGRATASRH
jgi:hypothetical protein